MLNDRNIEFYNQLKFYFSNDTQYEGDLKKGLLIAGDFGTGKTVAMEIYTIYLNLIKKGKTFAYFDTDEIIESYAKHGRTSIENYNGSYDICIDELGEDSGKHYFFGSVEDPIGILLYKRYKQFKDYGNRTHAVTNLNVDMLKERFVPKIYDRMVEMFNLLPLTGDSWRRPNF